MKLLLCLCSLQSLASVGAPVSGSFQALAAGAQQGSCRGFFLGRTRVTGWVPAAAALQKEILFVLWPQIKRVGNAALTPCAHSWFARESCCHGMLHPESRAGLQEAGNQDKGIAARWEYTARGGKKVPHVCS